MGVGDMSISTISGSHAPTDVLDSALCRRVELQASAKAFAQALAEPHWGNEGVWLDAVNVALRALRQDIEEHIAVTESSAGLHKEIITAQPRLANKVQHLGADHEVLMDRTSSMIIMSDRSFNAPTEQGIAALRDEAHLIIELLARHRQRSADLLYEAYTFEIGDGD